jgi:hypothetical protein
VKLLQALTRMFGAINEGALTLQRLESALPENKILRVECRP